MEDLAASAEDLGRAIAHLRGDRTQAEIARSCGLTRGSWSLYESGRRKPKAANIAKMLRGLGCTQAELEELAWQFRRRRLSTAAATFSRARSVGRIQLQAGEYRHAATGDRGSLPAAPRPRAVLARLNAALEEFFLLVFEARG